MFDPYHKWLGIPPKDQPPNHYRLLGIDLFESDPDVIDTAANRQMAYIQGCATGPHVALSQKLLNEIAAARLCLLTPAKKAQYDATLKDRLTPNANPIDQFKPLPSTPSQPAAIATASPVPTSTEALQNEMGLFDLPVRKPAALKRTKNQSKTTSLPYILGGSLLGVVFLVIVAVFALGKSNHPNTEKRQGAEGPEQRKNVKEVKKPSKLPGDNSAKTVETAKRPEIHIVVWIDGTDTLRISENDGEWIHHSFACPNSVKINDLEWDPQANPRFAPVGTSKLFKEKVDFFTARLSISKARGRVTLNKNNDNVEIYFDDGAILGADIYDVFITFEK